VWLSCCTILYIGTVGYDRRDNRRIPGGYLTAESHHHIEAGHAACLDRGLMTRHRGSELTARRISLQPGEQREAFRFVYDPQIQCRCKAIIQELSQKVQDKDDGGGVFGILD
jgi:hypothetical protein